MCGHWWLVLDELDDEPLLPVEPVVPDACKGLAAVLTELAGTPVWAGVLAALATAAPPKPIPKAPETTAAANNGFFIRMPHLLSVRPI